MDAPDKQSRPAVGDLGAALQITNDSSDKTDNNVTPNGVQRRTPEPPSDRDIIAAVRDTAAAAGIVYRDDIIADGELRRIDVEGERRGSKNGWYIIFPGDRPCAFGGTWVGDQRFEWRPKGSKSLSPAKRREIDAKIAADRARYKAERQEKYEAAARRANEIWAAAKPAPADHAYLKRKGIQAHDIRLGDWVKEWTNKETGEVESRTIKNALLIPIYVPDGTGGKKLVSLQAIFADKALGRDKDFLLGGKKSGGCFAIGKPTVIENLQTAVICEGYATAASIFEATNFGVYCAFDCGNLLAVAQAMRARFPNRRIVLAADDDRWPAGRSDNPGVDHARAAAEAIGGNVVVVAPQFANPKEGKKDFNDLHRAEGADVVARQIEAAIAATAAEIAPAAMIKAPAAKVIEIVEGTRHLIVKKAERLIASRADLFQMGGQLVRVAAAGQLGLDENIVDDDGGLTFTDPMKPLAGGVNPDWFTTALCEEIQWKKYSKQSETMEPKDPPDWVSRALIAHQDWPNIRPLAGITSAPIILPDGSVRTDPGYDPQTGMLLASTERFLPIPDRATKDDAVAAFKTLQVVFRHYQFSAGFGLSAALSLILTRLARHLMPLSPFHLITAPIAGGGKTKIAEVASIIVDGVKPSLRPWPVDDEAELRKSLTACVISSQGVVCFDNFPNGCIVSSPILDQFLTATVWEDRILSTNRNVRARNNLVLCGTGNNVRFAQDSIRRVLIARVLVDSDTPWKKHFEWSPDAYATAHRHELLQAACTILSAFIRAGSPAPVGIVKLGTFEAWSELVRNALMWLDLDDPCAGQEEFTGADETTSNLTELLSALHNNFGEGKFKVSGVLEAAIAKASGGLTEIGVALDGIFADKNSQLPNKLRLGRYLETHRDQPAGGAILSCHPDKKAKVNWWSIRRLAGSGG